MTNLFYPSVIVLGLLAGSFVNVLIYRIPRNIDFVSLRSRCESCQKLIRWYQNIPVLSFLLLRGKCAYCRQAISWRHPLVEIIIAAGALWLFPGYWNWHNLLQFGFFFSVFCAFVTHFFIDLDFQVLPDGVNLYLAAVFGAHSLFFHPWPHWLWGGVVGFGVPYGVTWLFYQVRKKIGMGGGDIKLYGALGLYLGAQQIMFTLFLSCLLGSLVGLLFIASRRMGWDRPIAFGPFIIIAASFQVFFPQLSQRLLAAFF